MADVNLDDGELEWLLNDPAGPVGVVIEELSDKATGIAKAACPVMRPENRSHWGKMFDPRFQYGPAGDTKAAIRASFPRFNGLGQMYGGVNAPEYPTMFLEWPARQIRSLDYRFMSAALDGVEL